MNVTRIVLLAVAVLAGGLAALLALGSGGEAPPAPTVAEKLVPEARARVLVATAPIAVGDRLSGANMTWRDWPEGALLDDYIDSRAMPDGEQEMLGAVARFEIFEGDPIRKQKLVKTEQGYLSAVLDKGVRAVSIRVSAESASGGFIVPNDYVDVILSRAGNGGQQAETIVSNVRVLAINDRLGEVPGSEGGAAAPVEKFADEAIATLALQPAQAETLVSGSQEGRLSLALRSIVDFATAPGAADEVRQSTSVKLIRRGVEATISAAGLAPSAPTAAP